MIDTQQPFKLANITVNPKTDELSCNGTTIEIKSMAMKVICYFAENKDIVISRDSLRDNVWQNSTASNHTINNHIYSLRQTFAKLDAKTKFFHTVTGAKSGYRLLAEISQFHNPSELNQELAQQDSSTIALEGQVLVTGQVSDNNKTVSNKVLAWLIVLALCFTAVSLFYVFNSPKSYDSSSLLTEQLGREQSPAISQNGEIIIYSNRSERKSTWELYASKMQAPLQVTKVFSAKTNNDNFVSISPNNKYLAFIRYAAGEEGIYIADFNAKSLTASNAKLIIPLDMVNLSPAISWLNESQFFYSAKEASSAPLKIYLYDLAIDRSEQISSPPVNNFGDFAAMVSPNKSWLAIMRSDELYGYQLHLYNLKTKTLFATKVKSVEERINISFSDDSQSVYFIDQQGFLSNYHIEDEVVSKISQQQYLGYWPLKIPGKDQFIMQQDWGLSSLTTQVIKINNPIKGGDGLSEVIVNNNLSIRAIEGIDSEGLIFASIKPNHHIELWKYQQGKAFKLNEFNESPLYHYPLSLHWLKSTDTALLSINQSCRLIDIRTGKDSPLCPADENVYAGRFSNNGKSILLAGFEQDNPSAIQMGASGYPVNELMQLKAANLIHENADGSFYYSQEPSFDIYYHNPITEENIKIINRTYINNRYSVNDFIVTKDGIYFMDRVKVTKNGIYFYDFKSKATQFVVESKDNYPNIVLSKDEQFIYLIESIDNDSKLLLID